MPIDTESKKLAKWADSGDRTDPDDTSLTPVLDRDTGWPSSFSATDGDTPRRAVFNQMFREITGLAVDTIRQGILAWDTEVNYLQNAIVVGSDSVLYRATADTGPDTSNATDPAGSGQTVWATITGTQTVPSAPDAPTGTTPSTGELDWNWNCPLDGGSEITRFDVQWRIQGHTAWSAIIQVNSPRWSQTGLTNGTAIELQVRAVTIIGHGPYSLVGRATPSGTVPAGGSQLALRAEGGDEEVDLDWLEPDDGGESIDRYREQWRQSGQSFSSAREQTTTNLQDTITLTGGNGTQFFFQVRAENSEGNGTWSNEVTATPQAVVIPPTPPADTAPDQPTDLAGAARRPLIVDWSWVQPDDDGGQHVSSYDFQWRYTGNNWSGTNLFSVDSTCYTITVANANLNIEGRVRSVNSVDNGAWSSTVTVMSGDLLTAPSQRHQFTTSQTWQWPYSDATRAVAEIRGQSINRNTITISLGSGTWDGSAGVGNIIWFVDNSGNDAEAYNASTLARQSSMDISLGSGDWKGGTSDGTTLWFVNDDANHEAVAYTASSQARDATKDISLGSGDWRGSVCDGTTLWFINNNTDTAVAYSASSQARDASKDIDLGTGYWNGGTNTQDVLWFINSTDDIAVAYQASDQTRLAANDIILPSGYFGGGNADNKLWFVNSSDDQAISYTALSISTLRVGGTTYSSYSDDNNVLAQQLTNLSMGDAITITANPAVNIYPQF